MQKWTYLIIYHYTFLLHFTLQSDHQKKEAIKFVKSQSQLWLDGDSIFHIIKALQSVTYIDYLFQINLSHRDLDQMDLKNLG